MPRYITKHICYFPLMGLLASHLVYASKLQCENDLNRLKYRKATKVTLCHSCVAQS